ncbi:PREDICTED: zinc finger CCCH domain-containing protein 38 [Tarenaya hassleriana]|uniref:zinc finger CCCH domain-containing protein 38 n=1 Tax=Tarenaya hassleriana TaxID=28532 RepID=UPI00053C395A|nr:PREDICTED: zinc finger CCCH domain-containing protein 38 [Tarenaya hassleriana]
MSGSNRKRSSRWDFKEEPEHLNSNARGDDYPGKSGSYFRDKESEPGLSYTEGNGRNDSKRLDDGEHLKAKHENRQHSGEAWPRSRVSHSGDGMIGYYDRQSPVRDRHNDSRSRSRSRSRSPVHRVKREAGPYDKQKSRARVSPQASRDFDGRYKRGGDFQSDQNADPGWEARNKKARDSKYYTDDSREQAIRGGRSDYSTDYPEDDLRREKRHLHEGTSDPVLRRHRNEREFSNIPCKFFAAGHCRNGKNCRFSHHGAARGSPDRKPKENLFGQDNNHSGAEKFQNGPRWNGFEKADAGKSGDVGTARANTSISQPKVNESWINDMEMSPDWDYGVKTFNKPSKDEHSEVKDGLWSHSSAILPQNVKAGNSYFQQDGNHRSSSAFSYGDKPVNNYKNTVNVAPIQTSDQDNFNHSALRNQNSLAVGGSQVITSAINLPGGLNSSNPENGKGYQENLSVEKPVSGDLESSKGMFNNANSATHNNATPEELNHISNISASLAQFFGNGQPLPHHFSTLTPQTAMQVPLHTESEGYGKQQSSVGIQPNQAAMFHSHNNPVINLIQQKGNEMNTGAGAVQAVTTPQTINTDAQQHDSSVPSAFLGIGSETEPVDTSHKQDENPKVTEEKKDKKTEESSKEEDGKKTYEESEDAENAEEDDKADGNKKGKDPKGIRAFKFALVETVKEILKPFWREGRMSKDAYKNIVKKVVDKVTGTMQNGNVPQTQEKIEHYLSASKPKLTKLVQAYISKVKKS